ncbi:nuclear transport factor 2 family protein [Dictyobacter aurantiacus]|uniref:SnoaL-like domain-containing protein n=1 Tax=Dictyobacter aurantiacus TaxID=1936993 RepID=A0A401ZBH7_9CHLR|nr:nuclear transport factor 2 family protein [Dictyobacter aurantiacus]GCE04209.1 hypothetical protein KDAU_15380 [Dictyobacter aurantiacus]
MNTSDTPTDVVRNLMSALDDNNLDTAATYLADDFQFSGWTPKPLDKIGFLGMFKDIKEGIPGLLFNLHNVLEQSENRVTGTIQIKGYQTDSFIIPMLGTPPIPQTANSVSLPTEDVTYQLNDSGVVAMIVQHTSGGGITGLLRQLGIDLPIVQ